MESGEIKIWVPDKGDMHSKAVAWGGNSGERVRGLEEGQTGVAPDSLFCPLYSTPSLWSHHGVLEVKWGTKSLMLINVFSGVSQRHQKQAKPNTIWASPLDLCCVRRKRV